MTAGVLPRGISHRSFTIDLEGGGVNTPKAGSRSSQESECAGRLAFFSNFGINSPTGRLAKKAILIRNAAAADMCKCETNASVTQESKRLSWRLLGYR